MKDWKKIFEELCWQQFEVMKRVLKRNLRDENPIVRADAEMVLQEAKEFIETQIRNFDKEE